MLQRFGVLASIRYSPGTPALLAFLIDYELTLFLQLSRHPLSIRLLTALFAGLATSTVSNFRMDSCPGTNSASGGIGRNSTVLPAFRLEIRQIVHKALRLRPNSLLKNQDEFLGFQGFRVNTLFVRLLCL